MADAEEPGGHQSSADERPSSGLIMERLGEAEAEDDTELVHREMEFAAAERLMFFTDAVVAIALTLLALQLPIPGGIENVPRSSSEMVRDAGQHFDDYLAFLISFVVIAAHWRLHHRVFRYVRVASRAMQFAIFAVIIVLILRTQHVPAGSDAQHMEDGLWQTIALAVGFAGVDPALSTHRTMGVRSVGSGIADRKPHSEPMAPASEKQGGWAVEQLVTPTGARPTFLT